ncbi:unnamed protein product [Danaus chrysippus]|uniref:(African queen) hypothetical protein n=1 Tax=Danaus chrysippus TaxID=151541 RepID=A0A8J2QWD5_9NEOP|nr:unnamed protein product [Danaus chrysippus]
MPVTRSDKGSERRESTPVGTAKASAPVVPATSERRVQETAAIRAERPASRLRVAPERDEPMESSTEPTTEATTTTTSYETTITETTKRPDDDSKTRTANRSRAASVRCDQSQAGVITAGRTDAEDPQNKEADVRQWLEETADTVSPKEHDAHAFPKELMETPEKECIQTQSSAAVKPDQQPAGAKDLAEAIIRAIQSVPKGGTPVPAYVTELPFFDGAIDEWLAFRTVYEDTEKLF